jgi:hypothetical protein
VGVIATAADLTQSTAALNVTVANVAAPTPTPPPTPVQWAIVSPAANAIVTGDLTVTTTGPLAYRVEVRRLDGTTVLSRVWSAADPSPSKVFLTGTLPSGPYVLALMISAVQNPPELSVPFTLDNPPTPTPTPAPTPTPTPAPTQTPIVLADTEHARIQAGLAAELARVLTPAVVTPPTCAVTITSVLVPYANGDWRFTVRSSACLPAPVNGTSLLVIK